MKAKESSIWRYPLSRVETSTGFAYGEVCALAQFSLAFVYFDTILIHPHQGLVHQLTADISTVFRGVVLVASARRSPKPKASVQIRAPLPLSFWRVGGARLNAAVLKTAGDKTSVGSNPTPSSGEASRQLATAAVSKTDEL